MELVIVVVVLWFVWKAIKWIAGLVGEVWPVVGLWLEDNPWAYWVLGAIAVVVVVGRMFRLEWSWRRRPFLPWIVAGLLAFGVGWGVTGGLRMGRERERVVTEYLRKHPETGVWYAHRDLKAATELLGQALETHEKRSKKLGRESEQSALYLKWKGQYENLCQVLRQLEEDIIDAVVDGELAERGGLAAGQINLTEVHWALRNVRAASPEVFGPAPVAGGGGGTAGAGTRR
jgi:hypothetical protein